MFISFLNYSLSLFLSVSPECTFARSSTQLENIRKRTDRVTVPRDRIVFSIDRSPCHISRGLDYALEYSFRDALYANLFYFRKTDRA